MGSGWLRKVKGSWLRAKMTLYLAKALLLEKAAREKRRNSLREANSFRPNPNWTGNG